MAQPLLVSRLYSDHSNIVTKPGIIIDYGVAECIQKQNNENFYCTQE